MKSEYIHVLIVVAAFTIGGYLAGFKTGQYYGSNQELKKIIRELEPSK